MIQKRSCFCGVCQGRPVVFLVGAPRLPAVQVRQAQSESLPSHMDVDFIQSTVYRRAGMSWNKRAEGQLAVKCARAKDTHRHLIV